MELKAKHEPYVCLLEGKVALTPIQLEDSPLEIFFQGKSNEFFM